MEGDDGMAQASAPPVFEPVPYWNPRIPDEAFFAVRREPDGKERLDAYPLRFVAGLFVASNPEQEAAVRRALAAHGRHAPDRWKGNDRGKEWQCRRCTFRTYNDNAKDDHEEKAHDD